MTPDREPADVEARLRASLRAYAEVVDESPAGRPPLPGVRRVPSPLRGWRAPALVAAAALAVAGGSWVVTDVARTPSPTAAPAEEAPVLDRDDRSEPAPDSSPNAAAEAAAAAEGPADQLVVPPPAQVGVEYPFDLYTHCGILGADVAGVWFAAEPPLPQSANGPPPGWDDPLQRGMLTLDSADEAVFRDDRGHELTLRAAPESERPPPCD